MAPLTASAGWKGRTALVTGAGSGIGRAIAQALAARGAFVVATDISAAAAAHTASLFPSSGRADALDVCDRARWSELVNEVVAARGAIDVLVNNAGVAVTGDVQDMTAAHWDRVFDVNVRGVVNGVLAAYPLMIRQRSGVIVNIASLAGLGPAPLLTPYAASKHAVVGLSTSLRIEAAPYGVQVNVVCPAAVETPLLDAGNPADLPAIARRPDIRRYLTRLGGAPYPAERLAEEALDGVERNKPVIVLPGRARMAWRLGRFAPGLAARLARMAVSAERAAWQ